MVEARNLEARMVRQISSAGDSVSSSLGNVASFTQGSSPYARTNSREMSTGGREQT
jgi:hypothetical protein